MKVRESSELLFHRVSVRTELIAAVPPALTRDVLAPGNAQRLRTQRQIGAPAHRLESLQTKTRFPTPRPVSHSALFALSSLNEPTHAITRKRVDPHRSHQASRQTTEAMLAESTGLPVKRPLLLTPSCGYSSKLELHHSIYEHKCQRKIGVFTSMFLAALADSKGRPARRFGSRELGRRSGRNGDADVAARWVRISSSQRLVDENATCHSAGLGRCFERCLLARRQLAALVPSALDGKRCAEPVVLTPQLPLYGDQPRGRGVDPQVDMPSLIAVVGGQRRHACYD
jgi:hypothetical protein